MINAHGGKLVNRVKDVDPSGLISVDISADLANDVENIADGIFSPLEGFLNQQDFESVISKGRLANGTAWTMPTVFDVDEETGEQVWKPAEGGPEISLDEWNEGSVTEEEISDQEDVVEDAL